MDIQIKLLEKEGIKASRIFTDKSTVSKLDRKGLDLFAVATFESKILNEVFDGDAVTLKVTVKGNIINQNLTRRHFISYLFGYLSFLAFFLYFLGVIANLISSDVITSTPDYLHIYFKWLFILIYLFMLSNLIITTLLGLYYMTDRIHR